MKKIKTILLVLTLMASLTWGQSITQTLRGTVSDADSKLPLEGVDIWVLDSDPQISTQTNGAGEFVLEQLPIGMINLQVQYEGYEGMKLPNVEINSGKEVILNLNLQESVTKLETVTIPMEKDKGDAINDMSLVSARSISLEESRRYAGSFNDPSRILSNFAGVSSSDASNDIIVRGNSPKYIQWRLEGVEITNPNHFADQNAVAGTVSALNNNLLATSDFQTGAFAPEYGDVLSGVYDVNMRSGNSKKREVAIGVGLIGTDFTLEGPFRKGYGGSFLINYRYSNTFILDKVGLADAGGIPKFQDMAFKVVLPTSKAGTFSLFGLGGLSGFTFMDVKPSVWPSPTNRSMYDNISEDYQKTAYLANTGINHHLTLSHKSFVKTTLSYSNDGIDEEIQETKTLTIKNAQGGFSHDSVTSKAISYTNSLQKAAFRGAITYNHKFDAKNKLQIGSKYTLFSYDYDQSQLFDGSTIRTTVVDFKAYVATLRNFISWKHRFNSKITMVGGFQNMNVFLNGKSTIEPRIALKWQINNSNAVHAGYGKHSTMESIHNYFAQVKQIDGTIKEPNKDLDLLKAHHFVIGYEKRFSKNLMLKTEAYYQDLYDLPVENNDTSHYATLNEGLQFRYVDLVNKGTGKNYGIELTLERFFHKNYYFLLNGSLYNSKYKTLEGIERNTQYNGNYLMNLLCGRTFQNLGKKNNQTLNLNLRIYFSGGKKIIPLLRDTQGNLAVDPSKGQFWDYQKAYNQKLDDTYQIILSASYKWNRPKATHEIFINLDNVTNNQGKISEYYDENQAQKIGYVKQFGLLPNIMYRVYF